MNLTKVTRCGFFVSLVTVCALTFYPRTCVADEFTLKDGRKIVGTIVGYDENMFRVQTDFGYVLIRRDKVVSIRVEPGAEKKAEETAGASHAPGVPVPAPAAPASPAPSSPSPRPTPPAPRVAPPAPQVSRPLNEPLPAHLRERVDGNTYINDTFQFAMYKPPDWEILEELHREKVSAIVAMSSQNQQTLLFVDRQVWSGEPNLNDDRVEANLRASYENYKKLSESSAQIDGLPAIRRNFTGAIDGVEWHGISVRIARGKTVFGIIGLTSDETYGFQEAVFNKMIRSFHFLESAPRQGASLQAQPQR
jgi:hypothetical protein